MKKRVTERVLVLILSIAVLLSSTGVYSVFAETYSEAVSSSESATVSSSSSAAESESVSEASQEATTSAETKANVVTEGGSVESDKLKGTGTENDPYLISNADDLFKMQDIINDSYSKNKYFTLVNDIDLSSVSYAQLRENSVLPGTIISVDKAKSDASPNTVRFTFNGKSHRIYGLNVDNTGSAGVAIFGYLSAKCVIKHIKFENLTVNVSYRKAVVNSVIALYNNGEIRNCEARRIKINVNSSSYGRTESKTVNGSLTLKEATGLIGINAGMVSYIETAKIEINVNAEKNNIGIISGINSKIISQVKSTGTINTSGCDAVGGIAGRNTGKIEFSTVDSIKEYVSEGAACGGIAGKNSGTIASCVTSGKANGSKYTGGIVGKAVSADGNERASKIKDSYSFMRVAANSETGAIVAGGESRYSNNVWCAETSGRVKAYADGSTDGNIEHKTKFIVVRKGETKCISKSSLSGSFGNVKYAPDTTVDVSFEGSGISCGITNDGIIVSASQANKIGEVTYIDRATVESGYENSATVSQKFSMVILAVSDETRGDGLSEATALEIGSGAGLRMISAVPYAHFKLTKDVTMPENWDSSFNLNGSFDGNGNTVYASKPFCSVVSGKINNLNVVLNSKITTAMFGDAESAYISNVKLTKAKNSEEKFIGLSASKSGRAAFLNSVSGSTTLKDCFCNVPVYIGNSSINSVAGFIAVLDGNNAVIKSCGVSTSITENGDEKVACCAAFIGNVYGNKNGVIKDCYATLYSDAAKYVLVGGGKKDIRIENAIYGASNSKAKAASSKFENIDAEKWSFESGENGFVTGNGSKVSIALPSEIIDVRSAQPKDFKVMFDAKDLAVDLEKITIENGFANIPVEIAKEGATVRNSSLVLVHKETGLRAEISISNGLEKDEDGNYLLNCGADFTYINDNFDDFKNESFIVTKDIDMSGVNFTTVGGAAAAFTGKIDGSGYTISGFKAESEAKAALFGTLDGATIKNITFESAKVKSEGSYAAVLAAQIKGGATVSNVVFKDCKVTAEENYAGILAAEIKDSTVKNIEIKNCKISAMNDAGVLAASAESAKINSIKADNITVSGDNNIGVIGEAADTSVKSVIIEDSSLSAKQTIGGIIGLADEVKVSDVIVKSTKLSAKSDALGSAPAAGGVCGVLNGTVSGAEIKSSKIKAEGNAAVAGGVAAVSENSEIEKAELNEKSSVSAAVVGGIVGEAAGKTEINNSKTFAAVKGSEIPTKVIEGAGGIIGRVAADDFGTVKINNANAAGSVAAADYAGGIIGSVLSQSTDEKVIENCVSSAKIDETVPDEEITSGHAIGYIAYLSEEDIAKAVDGVVFSSYSSDLGAYGNIDVPETYYDLDSAVESSLSEVITDEKAVTVKLSNDMASELGFVFDEDSGWKSDSEERVEIISSSENKVKIAAEEKGTVAVVGTYRLSADEDVALDVHFDAVTDIDTVLKGEGTKESPYIISNASELEAVSDYAGEKAYFEVTDDIAFKAEDFEFGGEFYNDGKGFKAIGSKDGPFSGVFNGNGHKISGIVINGADIGGLFGYTEDAEISDIIIKDAEITADNLAAGAAASIKNSSIINVDVINSSITAESAEGSAAAIAAYAENSSVKDVTVSSTEIEAYKSDSVYNVACASAVCARAIDTVIDNAKADNETEVKSDGIAAGFAGYCSNVKVSNSETYAAVKGYVAASAAGNVQGTLEISDTTAGGTVNGKEFAAGIAAKAYAAIKAKDVIVSAKISGDGNNAVIAAYADETVFVDSNDSAVEFSSVIYSSYQNTSEIFAGSQISTYQNASYLDEIIDVNNVTAKDGKLLVLGKDEIKLSEAVDFKYDMSRFDCEKVYSEPENLIVYDKADKTVKAAGTDTDEAKLVIRYDNGLEVAVGMVCIKDMTGEGTEASPYIIENEETLDLLRIYPDAEFLIKKDIDLTGEWIPVEGFTGKLDGEGHEISGLKVKADKAGLFASLNGNAKVENITFKDADVEGKYSAGVVAAEVTGSASISGINVDASNIKADDCAAAIAGSLQALNTAIKDCKVSDCTVSAENAAGIAALVSGNASITSSEVEASEIKGTETAGGVAALASAESLSIEECTVSADISADNAGGIVGVTEKSVKIANCTAEGTVNGITTEGGIIGYADGSVSVKGCNALSKLSGNAKNTAEIIAKFASRPEDNAEFAENFSNNAINGEFDEFEPAVMQYQNYVPAERKNKSVSLKGSGTEEDPYIIASAKDLAKIPDSSTDYFVLESDITLTENDYSISTDKDGDTVYGVFCNGYKPIDNFAGVFDGRNHVIKGLYIDSSSDYVGLFAKITATGTVRNLHVEILEASENTGLSGIKGNAYVGGIAGYCESIDGIKNCSVAGSKISGDYAVGGIVGCLASSKIISSFAASEIVAQNKAGGIAGITKGSSSISGCFTTCRVNAAGGSIVGANNGSLELTDIMVNGASHGTGAVAVGENSGRIKALRVLIAGLNEDKKTVILGADEAEYVYSDKTSLGIAEDGITALTTSQLTSAKPAGLDKWTQADGKYPVPAMDDEYSNNMAAAAAVPAEKASIESSVGNVAVSYRLKNNTGDRAMDSKLTGILIKSKANGTTITSDFFTTCSSEIKPLNKIIVASGGFYTDLSLPKGYAFKVSAKDSDGFVIKVSDAGSMGWYVESGAEEAVYLEISIVKADIPWGIFSLWESLAR